MATYAYKSDMKHCKEDFERGSLEEFKYMESYSDNGYRLVSVVSNFPNRDHDCTTYYWELKN